MRRKHYGMMENNHKNDLILLRVIKKSPTPNTDENGGMGSPLNFWSVDVYNPVGNDAAEAHHLAHASTLE